MEEDGLEDEELEVIVAPTADASRKLSMMSRQRFKLADAAFSIIAASCEMQGGVLLGIMLLIVNNYYIPCKRRAATMTATTRRTGTLLLKNAKATLNLFPTTMCWKDERKRWNNSGNLLKKKRKHVSALLSPLTKQYLHLIKRYAAILQ
jgi:hypothetical protein